ncbi:RNase adapter RapZ [Thermopolyspora sp. NPDC052614]|uniref:RapZ C-terminal domain-containing protein n=1 Tax=Thermopolyspora sp. NPDC052614 TaxID=3155682 RepID=UPI0034417F39
MMTDHGCAPPPQRRAEPREGPGAARVVVTSFGYGHGPAPEAELTIDARRYLRNPHHDPAMRHLTGLDAVVARHVLDTPGAAGTVEAVVAFARDLLTGTADTGTGTDGRSGPVRIAVGCAGGRHRSVALAQAITDRLTGLGIAARACHRDVAKPVIRPASPAPMPPAQAEAVTETAAEAGPVRVAQLAAVRVLAGLLQADLPVAHWRVSEACPGELTAQIGTWRAGEGERTTRIRAWAAALGGIARWTPDIHVSCEGGDFSVQADAGGVPVRVWTYLSGAPAAGTDGDRPGGDETDTGESGGSGAGCEALRAAVAVLGGLLEADRPAADWQISDRWGLSGQIRVHSAGDAVRAAAVEWWAAELGLTLRWQPYATGRPGGAWLAAGSVGDVRVEVWTWLPADPADSGGIPGTAADGGDQAEGRS